MLFGKKKKEGLPDLPPNPAMMPTVHDYNRPLPPIDPMQNPPSVPDESPNQLPRLPQTPSTREFGESATPGALTQEADKTIPDPPSESSVSTTFPVPGTASRFPTQKYKVVEMEEWKPEKPQKPKEIPQEPQIPIPPLDDLPPDVVPGHKKYEPPPAPKPMPVAKDRPIFVRIDNFKSARDSLDIVIDKLTEVEELLRMIREVKRKEDTELSIWESEMENIKARIGFVSDEIFTNTYKE